jgi:hypothetical protein
MGPNSVQIIQIPAAAAAPESGRPVFTPTSVPSYSRARCTWAIKAVRGLPPQRANTTLGLAAKVLQQLPTQNLQRHGGYVALPLLKLGNQPGAKHVGTSGQDLLQLDQSGRELLDCRPHLHRWRQPRQFGRAVPAQRMAGAQVRQSRGESAPSELF